MVVMVAVGSWSLGHASTVGIVYVFYGINLFFGINIYAGIKSRKIWPKALPHWVTPKIRLKFRPQKFRIFLERI